MPLLLNGDVHVVVLGSLPQGLPGSSGNVLDLRDLHRLLHLTCWLILGASVAKSQSAPWALAPASAQGRGQPCPQTLVQSVLRPAVHEKPVRIASAKKLDLRHLDRLLNSLHGGHVHLLLDRHLHDLILVLDLRHLNLPGSRGRKLQRCWLHRILQTFHSFKSTSQPLSCLCTVWTMGTWTCFSTGTCTT